MKIPIWVRRWNKKIHIYLGLYMLLFLWLFSISGLLINHHNWFQQQEKLEKPIQLPQGADDQAKAEDLRAQLGLSGDFRPARGNRKPPPGHFIFTLVGLERDISVDADLEKSVATIQYGRPKPKQVQYEKPIRLPQGADDQAKAEDLRAQLDLSGEILRARGNRKPPPGHFTFSLVGLDRVIGVDADLEKSVATIRYRTQASSTQGFRWTIENLHVLSGVRGVWGEPAPKTRDWWVVKLWSFALDAVSVGFMVLVITSIYMFYLRRKAWLVGSIMFAAGILSCSFFIWGMRWLT